MSLPDGPRRVAVPGAAALRLTVAAGPAALAPGVGVLAQGDGGGAPVPAGPCAISTPVKLEHTGHYRCDAHGYCMTDGCSHFRGAAEQHTQLQ